MKTDTQTVWEDFSGALKGFILSRVRDRESAEDILQEVFLKIHSGLANLENPSGLKAWLYAVARNATIDHIRKRRNDLSLEELPEESTADSSDPAPSADEFEPCLRALAERLPELYREPILLSEFEGTTHKEAGKILGLSPSAAKSRVRRGREKLKDLLLACCRFEFDRNGNIAEVGPNSTESTSCFEGSEGKGGNRPVSPARGKIVRPARTD